MMVSELLQCNGTLYASLGRLRAPDSTYNKKTSRTHMHYAHTLVRARGRTPCTTTEVAPPKYCNSLLF